MPLKGTSFFTQRLRNIISTKRDKLCKYGRTTIMSESPKDEGLVKRGNSALTVDMKVSNE